MIQSHQSPFCKNCENFMDITNNISSVENNNNFESEIEQQNTDDILIESSDYGISISEISGGDTILTSNMNNILNGSDTNINIKNFNIDDLNKNPSFSKLSNNQKTLVINRILEKIPIAKNKQNNSTINKIFYYYCKSCGYNEVIPSKQFIFSRSNDNNYSDYKFKNHVNYNILPKTKKYNCINDKCSTHDNPSSKLAVFYRLNKNTYNVRYICTVCDNFWNTFGTS